MVRMVALYPLKIGALALLFWYLVRGRLPQTLGIIVAFVLAFLIHIAIVALLTSRRRLADARLLRNSMRGEVPRDGARIAVAGTIEAEGDLLKTPFGGVPCVLYSYEIYRMVRPPSAKFGSTPERRVDFSGLALTPASIRTPNGRFALCGYPYLTGSARASGREASRLTAARDYIGQTKFERTVPFVGELAALDRAMTTVGRSIRLDSQMTDGDAIEDARFEEEYVADGTRACALGTYSAAEHGLVPGPDAEQRTRLIAGEGADVLKGLAAGARYSQVVATIMVLIVAAVLAFIFLAPKEMIDRVTGEAFLIETQQDAVSRQV